MFVYVGLPMLEDDGDSLCMYFCLGLQVGKSLHVDGSQKSVVKRMRIDLGGRRNII